MVVPVPSATTRWRCSTCGNLTRFDVTRSARTREFWHVDLGGDVRVEEIEEVAGAIEQVRCRWCGSVDSVVLVPRPDAAVVEESDRR